MQRYKSADEYYKSVFNSKVAKLCLISSKTCPNRIDGKGCIFCSEDGSGHFAIQDSIEKQIENQKKLLFPKWGEIESFIAYFQSYTNTYQDINKFVSDCETVLKEGACGISVSTRADCISDAYIEYFRDLNKRTHLSIELGLQTVNEHTLKLIKRGYSHAEFAVCVQRLIKSGLRCSAHIIIGLPGEDFEDYSATVRYVNESGFWGVKIHNLYIELGTQLYDYYLERNFKLLEKNEYVDIVTSLIAMLDSEIVIERLTGDGRRDRLFYPEWGKNKLSLLSEINKRLKEKNIYQGKEK